MTHYMNLVPSAFIKIANGYKTIELRLNDEKRKRIQINDAIIFNCVGNYDIIIAKVKALHRFDDFKALYEKLPLDKCGYPAQFLNISNYTDMERYYSKDQIKKIGALGIEIYNITAICDVKENIMDTDIINLLSPSVYNPTTERLLSRAKTYKESKKTLVYTYSENGKKLGIIVFEINNQDSTILDIAVNPENQYTGIGSKLIDFVLGKFNINKIVAETDDGAVGFYKNNGFVITDIKVKFDIKRYTCVKEKLK